MFRSIAITLTLCLATATAQAALLGRAALTPSGTDYQAYYDDVLNITWMADANYAQTSGYDADGFMTGPAAEVWVGTLNTALYLGLSNWRLPVMLLESPTICTGDLDLYNGGGDAHCGWNVDPSSSEMASLYYSTLGNIAAYDTSGNPTGCGRTSEPVCMANSGPFSNIELHTVYWAGTLYASNPSRQWMFVFQDGEQFAYDGSGVALAVSSGDPLGATVPIPPAVWLFGSALGLMGIVRRNPI